MVLATIVKNETILLDTAREHYFSLNAVGGRFWSLIAMDGSSERAVACIAQEFCADEAVVRADLVRLWDQLCANGLASAACEDGREDAR
ncbi:PqqD family protein [Novosphingobium sp. TH158]|uniref:PqqD family protein n=1 Tax=Novosphingobium sp. TH158 TaxID=2067455 RepID=UPI00130426AC|nr:PqqD family protein [Novosphingobium sp. TH158]